MQGQQTQRAYTLVELMVVIVIMAIVVTIAYPYVMETLYAMESKRVERAFLQITRQARAYSYTTRQDVVICTVDEAGKCGRGANTTLVLFYDKNRNNKKDEQDELIEEGAWRIKYGEILLRTSLNRDYIRYMGDTAKPRGHIGHLRYCSVSANKALSFKVIVNMYGGVRTERGDLVDVGC